MSEVVEIYKTEKIMKRQRTLAIKWKTLPVLLDRSNILFNDPLGRITPFCRLLKTNGHSDSTPICDSYKRSHD